MKLAPDAQAELDRHPTRDDLHTIIRKAGKVCVAFAEQEHEALKNDDLYLAGYYADAQFRWSLIAFSAAERLAFADQKANMQRFGMGWL